MLSTKFFLRLENRACFPTVKAEIGVCLDLAVMGFLRSTKQSSRTGGCSSCRLQRSKRFDVIIPDFVRLETDLKDRVAPAFGQSCW